MTQGDEDKAWQDIVDNWGDEPAVGAAPDIESLLVHPMKPAEPPRVVEVPSVDESTVEPEAGESGEEPWSPVAWEDEGRFVPPPPPPIAMPSPPRLLAWIGVIGSPAIFLVCVIFGLTLPSWAATLLVAAFIGGFAVLVATMRNEPRDPFDDGAVV